MTPWKESPFDMYQMLAGSAHLAEGYAEVELPFALSMSCDVANANVLVTPRYDPEDGRVPLVAVSAIKDGRFSISELNHGYCDVSWLVVAPYLP